MTTPLTLGWEEWLGLPDLGLPAIKAKIDTGARTSALHAFDIEPFGPKDAPKVRFTVHPVPERSDVEVQCSAPLKDRREVTSSNGETELRYVIATQMQIGDRSWPIELTLTDRGTMAYRMLLGRQALAEMDGLVVDPVASQIQPQLSFDVYKPRKTNAQRPLRIALLSREPDNYSTRRIVEAGAERGHTVDVIDTLRCYMAIDTLSPAIHYDGQRLPHYDAVIPRVGASITAYGTAVVRQFETLGTYCVNGSRGITASRDKLHAHQLLSAHKIGTPTTAFASSPKDTKNLIKLVGTAPLIVKLLSSTQGRGVVLAETTKAAESVISAFRGLKADFLVQHFVKEAAGEDIRCLVLGGKVIASMKRSAEAGEFRSNLHLGGAAQKVRISKAERETAIGAVKALGLGFGGVDLLRSESGPKVLEVNSSPGLEGIETVAGPIVAPKLIEEIEKKVWSKAVSRKKRKVP